MSTKSKPTPITKTDGFDEYGLPVGVVVFNEGWVSENFSLTKRQLRRYRTGKDPVLPCFRPSGPASPPMYRRSVLVAWLSR